MIFFFNEKTINSPTATTKVYDHRFLRDDVDELLGQYNDDIHVDLSRVARDGMGVYESPRTDDDFVAADKLFAAVVDDLAHSIGRLQNDFFVIFHGSLTAEENQCVIRMDVTEHQIDSYLFHGIFEAVHVVSE